MKLELSQGCICDSITIDNTEEMHLTDEQRRNVIDKVCAYLKSKPELLNSFLTWFLTWEGEYYYTRIWESVRRVEIMLTATHLKLKIRKSWRRDAIEVSLFFCLVHDIYFKSV